MGWGLLFIGYFLTFLPGQNAMLAVPLALPGCVLMLLGLKRLSLYCHTFHYAMWCSILPGAISVGVLVYALLARSVVPTRDGVTAWLRYVAEIGSTGVFGLLSVIAVVLFHAALAWGVKELAMRVGVRKNAVRALRNLIFVGLYAVGMVLTRTVSGLPVAVSATTALLGLVWSVCNCVMLYSCYMHIAPAEEAEEATRKPSRFAFVNRWRDAYEQKTQKAIDADRAYHEKNARERREKQLARMSKKQREKQELKQKRNQ